MAKNSNKMQSNQCSFCGEEISTAFETDGTCSLILPHQCEQCRKAFARLHNLKRHMLTHTGERPHQCEQCRYKFVQLRDLKVHMLTHSKKKMYNTFTKDH